MRLTPQLRFKSFNTPWYQEKLGKLTIFKSGNTPSKSNHSFWGGDIPWISASSMHGDSFYESKYRLTEQALKHSKIASKGSILLLVRGSMLFNKIPVGIATQDVAFNQDVKSINLKSNQSNQYLLLWFQANENRLLNMVTGTGIGAGKLDTEELQALSFNFPTENAEQQKIVSFLTLVDRKISQLTEKHRLLKEYKKSVMQQIFSQQLRFKDKDGKAFPEWESMNLDDVLLLQSDSLKMKDNESYELITVKRRFGGITSRGNYLGKDVLVKNQFTIHEDEFVISKRQIVHGACGLVPKELEGAIVSNEYNVFRPVADKLDLDYFNRFSTTPYMRRSYFINSDGVHIEKLLFKTQSWLKTKVDLPCLKEQQKIAQFLQSIDKKIDVVAQQVEQTKQFKKGLLQQMFV
ncbi:restriction endonuclease subunit S [Photobacterium phosphoreum]|uniref:restriction endonuclease subunit S n=1 Tax=Photobacterium phosphoreum TaxID=659 RepID=UPI000D160C4E|nr:restriction endonuclease subunit S [Photobacterium phosphoreum]PSU83835.1 hypothetical protein CTM67_00745 [Photobacterium phosphoreum]